MGEYKIMIHREAFAEAYCYVFKGEYECLEIVDDMTHDGADFLQVYDYLSAHGELTEIELNGSFWVVD